MDIYRSEGLSLGDVTHNWSELGKSSYFKQYGITKLTKAPALFMSGIEADIGGRIGSSNRFYTLARSIDLIVTLLESTVKDPKSVVHWFLPTLIAPKRLKNRLGFSAEVVDDLHLLISISTLLDAKRPSPRGDDGFYGFRVHTYWSPNAIPNFPDVPFGYISEDERIITDEIADLSPSDGEKYKQWELEVKAELEKCKLR